MNPTSRAILQTLIATDTSLSTSERNAIQRLMDGLAEMVSAVVDVGHERLLLTQKEAAKLLSVSRVTVWRLTKDGVLHPVEILPGTLRYAYADVAKLARAGIGATLVEPKADRGRKVAA